LIFRRVSISLSARPLVLVRDARLERGMAFLQGIEMGLQAWTSSAQSQLRAA
jgi:hypothetical protein